MASSTGTAQWSSRLAFILAAIGCSVGLGNLWRFSAEAGSNGGGAFIAVYLGCVIFILQFPLFFGLMRENILQYPATVVTEQVFRSTFFAPSGKLAAHRDKVEFVISSGKWFLHKNKIPIECN